MENINKHKELCKEMHSIYKYKNDKYGNSFGDTIDKYGYIAALTRINDKFSRIENNIINEIEDDDEELKDNLVDIANYCLMTVIELDSRPVKINNPVDSLKNLINTVKGFALGIKKTSDESDGE